MDIGCNNHNFYNSYDYCILNSLVWSVHIGVDKLHTKWQLRDRSGQRGRLLQSKRSDRHIYRFAFGMSTSDVLDPFDVLLKK